MYEELIQRLRSHNGLALNKTLDEAADAIEELEKFYQIMADAYETEVTKERWIPVNELLPEESEGLRWCEELTLRFTSVWCCDVNTGTIEVRNRLQGVMMIYKELIKRLREKAGAFDYDGRPDIACDYEQAADAIEALNGKATPKHVGFSSWKGYRNTRYKCPYCNKNVRNDEAYCHKCGQALMFPRISFTPYVPGETQEVIIEWPDEPPKEE